MDEATKAKILELHAQRASGRKIGERKIAEQLNLSKTAVHDVLAEAQAVEAGQGHARVSPGAGKGLDFHSGEPFLDTEARFASMLASYGIADVKRVVAYLGHIPGVYGDPGALRRGLLDQNVSATKTDSLMKHWCRQEGLPQPEPLPGAGSSSSRWTVAQIEGGAMAPVPDEAGEYETFAQALSVSRTLARPAGTEGAGGGEIAQMRRELAELRRERFDSELARRDAEIQDLRAMIGNLAAGRGGDAAKGEYDIMSQALTGLDKRAGEGLALVREYLPRPQMKSHPPETPEETARIKANIAEEASKQAELRRLEDKLFFGKKEPVATEVESKPSTEQKSGNPPCFTRGVNGCSSRQASCQQCPL